MSELSKPARIKGRGARDNPAGRFEKTTHEAFDDGWYQDGEPAAPPRTTVSEERARHIISRNASPDVPFDVSINPYRGCEHGCSYCYARPSHAYLNLSPGLDFETRLFAKTNAVEVLRQDLARPSYRCSPINLGANTDPYQPIERKYRITRGILQTLLDCSHPCTIITKNALIERDIDLLAEMARRRLVHCFVSVTSLDNKLSSRLEPRASAPHRRIQAIAALNAAGIPCSVNVAPIIPALTDIWIEAILEQAAAAGARSAGYTVVRLPYELKALFEDWLETHYPERKQHVLSVLRNIRGGELNEARFGLRMRGEGPFAELIRSRLNKACKRFGMQRPVEVDLDTSQFRPPREASPQGELFA
ncbi:PA0069 family radical SAM protein [Tahibacter harae]|uniref:PA0069 family radical SAM protein n=1 Tax=Tahibacter harae TaxID=2963937 RepID=A0ABT1QUD8_9GAMM|nr:PA0069 family radical SAM protein [Tahibacter harae]MCQ4165908.1 PA0069 family radical SAM protein [Tahibacter harae]